MSEVKTLVEMDESEMKEEIVNFGKIDVKKNRLIPNALVCWYKICINDDITQETRRTNSFMNHMAIVFENELSDKVSYDEDVNIKIQQMRDLVKISVL